jgi:hypothetical protein
MISKDFMLFNFPEDVSIQKIKLWLNENETIFKSSIDQSSCRKWSKWLEDKSIHLFPCCCPIREQDCIFIEIYYKLEKIVEMHSKEEYLKAIIQEYKIIANNKEQVSEWYKKHQHINSEFSFFDTEISIKLESEPYKRLKIQLIEDEYKNIIEFQSIFNEINNQN